MASLIGSRAVSPELWWFAFSADINIASAQDRLKYSFVGANQVMLHVLQVFLGDTANSVFVKTSPAIGQLYTITISGLLDLEGETVDDIIAELLPDILPAYPPTGIISLSADGEGWGSKLRANTEYWSKLIGINGIVGAMVYPFAHSIENPADYELDTAVLGEPVSELAIRPIVMPQHASEFTADQTADLVVAIPSPRLLPDFSDLYIRNTSRPAMIPLLSSTALWSSVKSRLGGDIAGWS